MINYKTKLTKEKLNKESKQDTLKLDLIGIKTSEETKERTPLNIALVIDCSGSMSAGIDGKFTGAFLTNLSNFGTSENESNTRSEFVSKIDMAKKSALSFIENLNQNDFISLVVFGDNSKVILPSMAMTDENKIKARDIIEKEILPNKGMTNLYDGWVDGVKEITNNIKKEALNRVIVLTDGQLNRGETNQNTIRTSVLKMYEASISTTTFGIGEDFNEDLLQTMSSSGGGNSYYINDSTTFKNFIQEEITGITNVVAKDIRLKLEFSKSFSKSELLNDAYERNSDGYFIIPSVRKDEVLPMIFDLHYSKIKSKNSVNIGNIQIEYTDENNETVSIKKQLKAEVCEESEWIAMEENKDVIIEKELMEISKLKTKARDYMDKGDIASAKEAIQSISKSSLAQYDEKIYGQECSKMNNLMTSMNDQNNYGSVRKMMSYESYYTQRGK